MPSKAYPHAEEPKRGVSKHAKPPQSGQGAAPMARNLRDSCLSCADQHTDRGRALVPIPENLDVCDLFAFAGFDCFAIVGLRLVLAANPSLEKRRTWNALPCTCAFVVRFRNGTSANWHEAACAAPARFTGRSDALSAAPSVSLRFRPPSTITRVRPVSPPTSWPWRRSNSLITG